MRLWHKDLIPFLPDKQLLGQWRECCAIAKNIAENGTPNHILVNRIMDYPIGHFYIYGVLVYTEMKHRRFKCEFVKFAALINDSTNTPFWIPQTEDVFNDWHNNRYLTQCFYNLQEKYDCGGISKIDWDRIHLFMESRYRPI